MAPSTAGLPPNDIFHLIHDLHRTVTKSIDTSLSWEQLNSPPINYSLVRPIVERFAPPRSEGKKEGPGSAGVAGRGGTASDLLRVPGVGDDGESGSGSGGFVKRGGVGLGGVLFALMANRVQFINLANSDLSYEPLQTTRAAFCELLAMKILRTFPHPEDEAELVGELVKGFCAFDGAPQDVWTDMGDDRKDVEETRGSAIELAIVSMAKHLLSLPLIQHLIHEIHLGHLIYNPISSRSLIVDSYVSERTRKRRTASSSTSPRPALPIQSGAQDDDKEMSEVYVYNPFEAGWLDHQRLRVPKWRTWMEFGSFAVLIALYVATLAARNLDQITPLEIVFILFSFGFILEEFAASKEHGWTVYSANAFNAFDMAFILVFLLYLVLRIFAVASHAPQTSDLAFDILSCGACILFPRLVFFLIRDNIVILALKVMIARFVSFMGLVILAFSGICFCLWTLGRGTWTVKQIVWLMLQIWFGSSYLGFSASSSFHPIFGPIILIAYAALCNVLLITILIAILSNAFAEINQNAQEEHLFQRVVKTVEGVKSDAVFSYLPPINLLAFVVLYPLSFAVSPRTLHRINVFAIRLTSFPILFAISAYERHQYRSKYSVHLRSRSLDRIAPSLFDSFLGSGGSETIIASVFEVSPPSQPYTPPNGTSDVPETDEPPQATRERTTNVGFTSSLDSPLAKLFGRASAISQQKTLSGGRRIGAGERPYSGGEEGMGEGEGGGRELDRLKVEMEGVRESQLRMEEMLAKVLGGHTDK